MGAPFASPRVRAAIGDLVVAAEQLQLMLTRAAVVGHPLHPALERLALGAVHAATAALLAAASFVSREVAYPPTDPASGTRHDPRGGSGR